MFKATESSHTVAMNFEGRTIRGREDEIARLKSEVEDLKGKLAAQSSPQGQVKCSPPAFELREAMELQKREEEVAELKSELEELGQRFQQVAEANQLLVTEHKHLSVECADLQHDLRELGMAHTTAKQLLDEKDKECLRLHELKEQIAGKGAHLVMALQALKVQSLEQEQAITARGIQLQEKDCRMRLWLEVVAAKAAVIQHQNALLNDRDAKLRVLQSEMNDLVFSLQSRLQGDQQIKAMAEKAMQEKEGECRSLQHKLMGRREVAKRRTAKSLSCIQALEQTCMEREDAVVAYDGRLCNLQIEWQRLLQHNRQRCESLQKTCQAQAEANAQMQGRVGDLEVQCTNLSMTHKDTLCQMQTLADHLQFESEHVESSQARIRMLEQQIAAQKQEAEQQKVLISESEAQAMQSRRQLEERMRKLQRQLEVKSQNNQQLTDLNGKLTQQIAQCQEEKGRCQEEKSRCAEDLRKKRDRVKQLEAESVALQTRIQSLSDDIATEKGCTEELQHLIEQLFWSTSPDETERLVLDPKERAERMSTRYAALRQECDQQKEALRNTSEQLCNVKDALHRELEAHSGCQKKLVVALEAAEREPQLQKLLASSTMETAKLQGDLRALQEDSARTLQSATDAHAQAMDQLQMDLAEAKKAHSDAGNQNIGLQASLAAMRARIEEADLKEQTSRDENAALKEEVHALKLENSRLQADCTQLSDAKMKIQKREQRLKSEVKASNDACSALKKETEQWKTRATRSGKACGQLKSLQDRHAALNTKYELLQAATRRHTQCEQQLLQVEQEATETISNLLTGTKETQQLLGDKDEVVATQTLLVQTLQAQLSAALSAPSHSSTAAKVGDGIDCPGDPDFRLQQLQEQHANEREEWKHSIQLLSQELHTLKEELETQMQSSTSLQGLLSRACEGGYTELCNVLQKLESPQDHTAKQLLATAFSSPQSAASLPATAAFVPLRTDLSSPAALLSPLMADCITQDSPASVSTGIISPPSVNTSPAHMISPTSLSSPARLGDVLVDVCTPDDRNCSANTQESDGRSVMLDPCTLNFPPMRASPDGSAHSETDHNLSPQCPKESPVHPDANSCSPLTSHTSVSISSASTQASHAQTPHTDVMTPASFTATSPTISPIATPSSTHSHGNLTTTAFSLVTARDGTPSSTYTPGTGSGGTCSSRFLDSPHHIGDTPTQGWDEYLHCIWMVLERMRQMISLLMDAYSCCQKSLRHNQVQLGTYLTLSVDLIAKWSGEAAMRCRAQQNTAALCWHLKGLATGNASQRAPDQGLQLPSSKQLSESAAKSKGGCESLTVWQTLDSEQSSIPDSGINNPSKPPRLGSDLSREQSPFRDAMKDQTNCCPTRVPANTGRPVCAVGMAQTRRTMPATHTLSNAELSVSEAPFQKILLHEGDTSAWVHAAPSSNPCGQTQSLTLAAQRPLGGSREQTKGSTCRPTAAGIKLQKTLKSKSDHSGALSKSPATYSQLHGQGAKRMPTFV
jgi:chromosome segregation ATPase